MLSKIEKLINFKTFSYNKYDIKSAFNFLKETYHNLVYKELNVEEQQSILFSNYDTLNFDVLSITHIDIVNCNDYLLKIKQENNKLFARGIFDMKSFIISALENLIKIKNIKYGVLIVSDEEMDGANGSKYWCERIGLRSNVILDSDNGYNLDSMIVENTNSATIKINDNYDENLEFIKNNFYIHDIKDNEVDLSFEDKKFCIFKKIIKNKNFEKLLFNPSMQYNQKNKFFQKYKNILEKNLNKKVNFTKNINLTDSRYFIKNCGIIIVNQATGGGNHKETEWLDYNSFLLFNKIQKEFLENYNE